MNAIRLFEAIRNNNDLFYQWITPYFGVPDGYELIETAEHKKERLQKEINEKKASVDFLTKRLTELTSEIESEQKELLALSSNNTK